jgi:hypothetical protein
VPGNASGPSTIRPPLNLCPRTSLPGVLPFHIPARQKSAHADIYHRQRTTTHQECSRLFPSPFFRLSSSLVYRGRLKTEWHVSRAIAFVWKDGSKEGTSTTAIPAFAFQLVFLPTIRNATGSEIRYLDLGRPRSLSFGVLLFQGLEVSAQPKVEKPNQKLGSNLLSRIRGSSALV